MPKGNSPIVSSNYQDLKRPSVPSEDVPIRPMMVGKYLLVVDPVKKCIHVCSRHVPFFLVRFVCIKFLAEVSNVCSRQDVSKHFLLKTSATKISPFIRRDSFCTQSRAKVLTTFQCYCSIYFHINEQLLKFKSRVGNPQIASVCSGNR